MKKEESKIKEMRPKGTKTEQQFIKDIISYLETEWMDEERDIIPLYDIAINIKRGNWNLDSDVLMAQNLYYFEAHNIECHYSDEIDGNLEWYFKKVGD